MLRGLLILIKEETSSCIMNSGNSQIFGSKETHVLHEKLKCVKKLIISESKLFDFTKSVSILKFGALNGGHFNGSFPLTITSVIIGKDINLEIHSGVCTSSCPSNSSYNLKTIELLISPSGIVFPNESILKFVNFLIIY